MLTNAPLLEINDLKTHFFTRDGIVRAVDGVSFSVAPGETLAVVGESGCGKSVTSLSIMRLVASPPGRIVGGSIRFQGKDLLALSEREMRSIRGNDISMIFQEPMTSLNPVLSIGRQITETLTLHQGLDRAAADARAIEMLRLVGIPEPAQRLKQYPHELSGGMRQRVALARALAQDAEVLLMDEPFGALDAITRDILHDELERVVASKALTVVFVTHNVREAARLGDRIVLLSSRPGTVASEFPVAVPRPRRIEAPEVAAIAAEVTVHLRGEMRRHG
jgi:peptide/nickel transport system ATP-binding protein